MELTPITNLVLALIILILTAAVFAGAQMKTWQAKVARLAYHLHFEVTRKADLLPQIMTRLTTVVESTEGHRLIDLRYKSMLLPVGNQTKKALDDELWQKFSAIRKKAKSIPELKKDLILLALEKELLNADDRIAEVSKIYNSTVTKYNRLAGFILLKPVSLLIKAGHLESY